MYTIDEELAKKVKDLKIETPYSQKRYEGIPQIYSGKTM
jgi:hypothetical protein